jgi:hypothetical protein
MRHVRVRMPDGKVELHGPGSVAEDACGVAVSFHFGLVLRRSSKLEGILPSCAA